MYIEFVITATDYTFQRKDEAGTNIGAADSFAIDDYRVDVQDIAHYVVQLGANPVNYFPPVAAYPKERTILTT